MNNIVSVVIPVYNVEKYLRECLDSVIGQTYRNLQIILVDDGSTDSSGVICDEYAKKDERIMVVHQKNQGAGAAKNTGLELVRGEYLSLIDSDDYIEQNFYEVMINAMEQYHADMVQCLFDNCFVDRVFKRQYNFLSTKARKMGAKKFLFELLYDWKYAIFGNKLFKTKLLDDARFPVGRKIDDEFFTYKLICNANEIVNINEHLYHYRMRRSSVMNDSSQEKFNCDRLACFEERLEYIADKEPSLKSEYYKHLSNNFSELYPQKIETIIQKLKRRVYLMHYAYDSEDNMVGTYYE